MNTEQILQPATSSGNASLTYTVKDVAKALGISLRKAYNLCEATNDFKVFRFDRSIRVHKRSFDDWFNACVDGWQHGGNYGKY